jgi:hypothetical protein
MPAVRLLVMYQSLRVGRKGLFVLRKVSGTADKELAVTQELPGVVHPGGMALHSEMPVTRDGSPVKLPLPHPLPPIPDVVREQELA